MKNQNKHKKIWILAVVVLCAVAAVGVADVIQKRTAEQPNDEVSVGKDEIFAMDTVMDLTVYAKDTEKVLSAGRKLITQYEQHFSVNIEDSDISKCNRAEGKPVKVSDETYDLIRISKEMTEKTGGLFDISIYPIVRAWGFTTQDYKIPDESERKKLLSYVDASGITLGDDNTVTLKKGMEIDLGGIAKGYLSQKLVELFQKEGAVAGVVSLGGNVQTFGKKEDGSRFTIGITDPADGQSVLGTLEVDEKAVITSGSYQRYFEENGKRYHHIMDPRTGAPAESDLLSVTVICDRGEQGDALATSLFVMGKEKAIAYAKENDLSLILVDQNNEIWTSEGVDFRTAK